jgi:isopentenyl diphosphate isomerase/L-lactate dehydrogenase-like FMN-dependent dehydrogenase
LPRRNTDTALPSAREHEMMTVCSAAASTGTIFTLSTMSTVSIEDVANAAASAAGAKASLFFQLYVMRDYNVNQQLIERAERAGYSAIVVTVDVPVIGKRRDELRNRTQIPSHLK